MNKINLFVIPFAGGSSSSFPKVGSSDIGWNVIVLDTPGKGKKDNEQLVTEFENLVMNIYQQICTYIDTDNCKEYAILGHSLGSYVAYEVVKTMERLGTSTPTWLFLTGTVAPDKLNVDEIKNLFERGDESIINHIVNFGYVNNKIAHSSYFMKIFYPIVKADYSMLVKYCEGARMKKMDKVQICCPVMILNGKDDLISEKDVLAWQDFCKREIEYVWFMGKHFFIIEQWESILSYMWNRVEKLLI
ncbi:thioesterase II family protein [Inconstantimicrobium mannanitabidum]|uniref:Thioesterase n=1 Tax=Inconstantimicrobium mannanitabidum TaxID=1604901 RepID=A0ACB5RH43_9CLOT|nr:thioesterase domain-containing protein [Clostridium sp. TW13]GKX68392.1 thioesterase [Clostridium sp. TW13]